MRLSPILCRMMLLAIACTGLPNALLAQRTNDNQPVRESVNVSFQVYLWSTPPHQQRDIVPIPSPSGGVPDLPPYQPTQFSFVNATGSTEGITAATKRMSRTYRYSGTNPLVFVQEQQGLDGEMIRTELAQVQIPPNATRVLLLVFPSGSDTSESYRVIAIPTSEREMPSGTALVLNIAENEIATRIGSEQVLLNGGSAQQISLKGFEDGALPVIVGARDTQGQWQQTYANNFPIPDRATAIFVLHEETGNAHMQMIRPNPGRDRQATAGM